MLAPQDALRELNIHGMPPEKETAQVKKVSHDLGSYLTQARHSIKDHVCINTDLCSLCLILMIVP
jgi:hypothetical protein